MTAPNLELEGTSPEQLRRMLTHSKQGLHNAQAGLEQGLQIVRASEARVKSWTTSIDQIRAALRQLGEGERA